MQKVALSTMLDKVKDRTSIPIDTVYPPISTTESLDIINKMNEFLLSADKSGENTDSPLAEVETVLPELVSSIESESTNYDIELKTATLMSVVTSSKGKNKVVTVSWLCNGTKDELLTISVNYNTESKEEIEYVDNLHLNLYNDNIPLGLVSATTMILDHLPCYATDMEFDTSGVGFNQSDKAVYLTAVRIMKCGPIDKTIFKVGVELMTSMKYMDEYIMNMYTNQHNASVAIYAASKANTATNETFIIDLVDSIVWMAPVGKGDKKEIAVAFKATHFVDRDVKEEATILCNFDFGCSFPKSKFRGVKAAESLDKFLSDRDRYATELFFTCRFTNVDKEYTCFKGRNKDMQAKLFMMGNSVREQFETMVKNY